MSSAMQPLGTIGTIIRRFFLSFGAVMLLMVAMLTTDAVDPEHIATYSNMAMGALGFWTLTPLGKYLRRKRA